MRPRSGRPVCRTLELPAFDQPLRIAALGTAARRIGLLPLEAQVREAGDGEGQTDVCPRWSGHHRHLRSGVPTSLQRSIPRYPRGSTKFMIPAMASDPYCADCAVAEHLEAI